MLKTRNNKKKPGTARKSESVLEPEPEPPDDVNQFWNRTRNCQIIWASSRTGTGIGGKKPFQKLLKKIVLLLNLSLQIL